MSSRPTRQPLGCTRHATCSRLTRAVDIEWQGVQEQAREAPEEILEREMPTAIYQLMHAHARLSNADRDRLARGLANTLGRPAGESDSGG